VNYVKSSILLQSVKEMWLLFCTYFSHAFCDVAALQENTCLIDGNCYLAAEFNPVDILLQCDPATSRTGWSDGMSCNVMQCFVCFYMPYDVSQLIAALSAACSRCMPPSKNNNITIIIK